MELVRLNNIKQYNIVGEQCNGCEKFIFPPRDVCPSCGAYGVIYKAPTSSETSPKTVSSTSSK